MIRRLVLVIAFGLLTANLPAAERPNLLVIHTDEHNFRTLGAYRALLPPEQAFIWGAGLAVETPNIDWLAKHGAICDRFYATSPVCTPSRASLVSGRYPQRTGAITNDVPMHDSIVTFAEVLRRSGYATGYAGKWHLDGPARPGWAPSRQFGFEDNRYMFNRGHWKKLADSAAGPKVDAVDANGDPSYDLNGADSSSFTTDFLADRAVDFIRKQKDRPFCYMVSIPDPHGPNRVRLPYDTMFMNLKLEQPRSARSPGTGLPSYASVVPDAFDAAEMARYFGMVKCIDDNVGKIMKALREAGVLEKTFIVFTSDHGDLCGEHGRYNKGVPLEASARIPFLIYAPGVIRPGKVVSQALATVDFKPTILALMGVTPPTPDDGRDASSLFLESGQPRTWNDVTFVRIGRPGSNVDMGWMGAFSRRYKFIVAAALIRLSSTWKRTRTS